MRRGRHLRRPLMARLAATSSSLLLHLWLQLIAPNMIDRSRRLRRSTVFAHRHMGLLLTLLCMLPRACVGGDLNDDIGWGVIASLPARDSDAYFKLVRTDYTFKLEPDYIGYSIDLRVDPCRDLVRAGSAGKECCSDTNTAGCQHHPSIKAGADLQIAYFQNAHIPTCAGTIFEGDPNCGTYIEVHRPFLERTTLPVGAPELHPKEREILGDMKIDGGTLMSGYRKGKIPTHRLCLGDHELWWVVRTRSGPFVQKIQPFSVERPSCPAPEGAVPAPDGALPSPAVP
eukprot:TRINITY_DN49036_c0_g1_i1.p1 TRINITY_DN49036_c0_g1~~TRINITY_DN49036_c0_g1_i1.p1  ORF type:complete len:286 (-),score=20.48 TRINITY_DN49036_c0_g1_i1:109-966(-)